MYRQGIPAVSSLPKKPTDSGRTRLSHRYRPFQGNMLPAGWRMIVAIATALSIASTTYFYRRGLILAYGDAESHLNIARRVFDNITPGIAQLGAIWLPLPHILMLPLIWFDPLWKTGLAGSVVSMIAYIVAAVFIYGSVMEITHNKVAAVLGALVMMLCPSMLYMQSTAMTEALMISTSAIALYFLVRWGTRMDDISIIFAAGGLFLASMSRYDAWFYIPTMCMCIALIAALTRDYSFSEGATMTFISLAVYGVVLWMFYNWLIFGDPLNFSLGKGSASWYAQKYTESTGISTKWNAQLSLKIYFWTMVDTVGWGAIPVIVLGPLVYLWKWRLQPNRLAGYVFLSPIIFNVVSLFVGQSVLASAHIPPGTSYNVRYGLMALPAVAFFAGVLASMGNRQKIIPIAVLAAQFIAFSPLDTMPIIAEPVDSQAKIKAFARQVNLELKKDYHGGKILVSSISNDALIFALDVPLKSIIFEGNHPYWDESLEHPNRYATWVIANSSEGGDDVYNALLRTRRVAEEFDLIYENEYYQIYRNRGPTLPLP